ncbi:FMN-binding protein [Streptomyces sp. AS58]|uniref:FMN-binding protein n=1 Tax=Streptomyces TaxID=1883 RepID=UPI0006B069DA|nr:FMN-binding protein [Streptomyces sp. AS58]KOV64433.1 FMN-binding protein [Streptomyces sp. AS58]
MKKNHPVRRAVLVTAATVSGIVLLLTLKPASDPGSAAAVGGAAPGQTAGAGQSPQGGARDAANGIVDGDVAQTQYGPVQVRLTVSNGKITRAEAVQAPSGGRSTEITADAVPQLNEATVAAGSADIDAVSGATYTSGGYKQSLQSALDRIRAGGGAGGGSGSAGDQGSGGAGQGAGNAGEQGSGGEAGQDAGAAEARTLTGAVAQTEYGPVQVRVTVQGGKITRAEAVQAPSGGRSTDITADAVPRLNKAAVAAGSADIDAVSGATYTSGGYKQSLQSALDQAGG